jgi:short-subunit dehydrogenase
MRLDGRIALLTGASGGLGGAIARALAARGATVLLSARRVAELEALAEEIGGRALPADLASSGATSAVEALVAAAGHVDVLVSNAGLPGSGELDSLSPAEIDRVIDVNLRAPMQLARLLAPSMRARRTGHLLFVSSLSDKAAGPHSSVYSATKFGLRGFALALRQDLAPDGVGVSLVSPGFVRDAGLFADSGAALPRGVGTSSPAEVAAAVVRAIERDKAAIDVAPLGMRAGARIAVVAPVTAAAVQKRLGSFAIARAIAAGQRDKR